MITISVEMGVLHVQLTQDTFEMEALQPLKILEHCEKLPYTQTQLRQCESLTEVMDSNTHLRVEKMETSMMVMGEVHHEHQNHYTYDMEELYHQLIGVSTDHMDHFLMLH